jgi:LPS export ABC transporter protein LptC
MSKYKIILYTLLILIVAGTVIGVMGYHRLKKEPEVLISMLPKNADLTLNRIHHVATRDGVREWSLDAASAQYQKAENRTLFKEIDATFYLEDGRTAHLSSEEGILLTDSKNIEVWGRVVLRSGPYELSTEKLRYEHGKRRIWTEAPIAVKGQRMTIKGDGMSFDLETEKVVIEGRVEASFKDLVL